MKAARKESMKVFTLTRPTRRDIVPLYRAHDGVGIVCCDFVKRKIKHLPPKVKMAVSLVPRRGYMEYRYDLSGSYSLRTRQTFEWGAVTLFLMDEINTLVKAFYGKRPKEVPVWVKVTAVPQKTVRSKR